MEQYLRQKGTNDVFLIGSDGGAYKVDEQYALANNVFPQVKEVDFRIDTKYPLSGPVANAPKEQNIIKEDKNEEKSYYDTGVPELNGLLDRMAKMLEDNLVSGNKINPNIELDPSVVSQFLSQAESEFEPYYSSQIKLIKEDLGKSLDYLGKQYTLGKQEAEDKAAKKGLEVKGYEN